MPRDAAPLDGLDLNLLVTLRALLTERNVTRAARRLGQSQPTVSRSLQVLREAFGDELLVRSGRAMVATPLAQALLAPVEQLLLAADRLRTVGSFEPAQAVRRFSLSTSDLVSMLLVPMLAQRVGALAPGVTLVVTGSERDQLAVLLNGEVDLAVGLALDHAELFQRAFGGPPIGWSVLLGPRHPAYHGKLDRDGWLRSAHVQLVPDGRPHVRGEVDERLRALGLTRRIALQIGHLATIAPTLERTEMVTSLPTPIAERIAEGRQLQVITHPLNEELPALKLYLNWHARMQEDAGHAWLRDQLANAFEG